MSEKGQQQKTLTKAQRRKAGLKICAEYAKGEHTIDSICESVDVPVRTFYNWITEPAADQKKPSYMAELADAYKKAKEAGDTLRKELLRQHAETSLSKKVKGYTFQEVKREGLQPADGQAFIPTKQTVTVKHVPPDTTAIIFALKNLDPKTYSDVIIQRHEGKVEVKKKFESMSDEELIEFYEKYKHLLPDKK